LEGPPQGGPSVVPAIIGAIHSATVSEPVHLELVGEEHLPLLEHLVADPLVRKFTRVPDPPPPGFATRWYSTYAEGRAAGTHEAFAIVADGEAVGVAVAPSIDVETGTIELGYVLAAEARGRGVAKLALAALTAWAVRTHDPERIELLISVDNHASQAVAERCGYLFEGTLRNSHVKPGVRMDMQVWSLVRSDREGGRPVMPPEGA
jgi:RimJ/RimL family protein N-acetyltransferase